MTVLSIHDNVATAQLFADLRTWYKSPNQSVHRPSTRGIALKIEHMYVMLLRATAALRRGCEEIGYNLPDVPNSEIEAFSSLSDQHE